MLMEKIAAEVLLLQNSDKTAEMLRNFTKCAVVRWTWINLAKLDKRGTRRVYKART